MSSNLQLKKVCAHCNEIIIAQKITTKCCSLTCAQRNYKLRLRKDKVKKNNEESNLRISQPPSVGKAEKSSAISVANKELIDIKMLAAITSISERTLFNLIKNEDFPKLRIGRSLLFHKETVVKYLVTKYGNL